MKKIHLICNAHLDPMWQWEWEDGAAACLATFYSAAELADEFDYIFCHNEALLYKYVKEYDPKLFGRIKELVKAGKWHIMGGWFLQPDCNMPSGESLVRQIQEGKKFFLEEFGVFPSTAINFDSFGHNAGLPQIMKKCGQDSYMFCRPMPGFLDLKDDVFDWQGVDGSTVHACRIVDENLYTNALGNALEEIKRKVKVWSDNGKDVAVALWGVGNHGGGPSRKDLKDIKEFQRQGGCEVIHSTPEEAFKDLPINEKMTGSLHHFSVGCYSSMTSLKQRCIRLENELFTAEKLCSVAEMKGVMEYPREELAQSMYDLLYGQFHDLITGTSIKAAEQACIRMLEHGLEIVARIKARALFKVAGKEKRAAQNANPVFVFNPNPYPLYTTVESEIRNISNNIRTKRLLANVFQDGQLIVSQIAKERSYINYESMKRVAFDAVLKALDVTRFDVYFEKREEPERREMNGDFVYESDWGRAVVDGVSGLPKSFVVGGKEYLGGAAFIPYVCDDNEDPWGMSKEQLTHFNENPVKARLGDVSKGVFSGLKNISVIEDGDIFTEIESLHDVLDSKIRIGVKLYKNHPYIDVNVTVFWNEIGKMLKIEVPAGRTGKAVGQISYGTEELISDGREHPRQRFLAIEQGKGDYLALLNNCVYGCSAEENVLRVTLLRGLAYCAHPIEDLPLVPQDRLAYRVENGVREFNFRLIAGKERELERLATEYCQKIYTANFFPHGTGETEETNITIDNKNIVLTAMKKGERTNGYVFRLFNNSAQPACTQLSCRGKVIGVSFGKYEIKTVVYSDGHLREIDELII